MIGLSEDQRQVGYIAILLPFLPFKRLSYTVHASVSYYHLVNLGVTDGLRTSISFLHREEPCQLGYSHT